MITDKEWQELHNALPTGEGKKHTLACGVAVGDIIETPYGEPGKVIGMSHKGMDVDVKGLNNPKFIPFAGNTNLEVLKGVGLMQLAIFREKYADQYFLIETEEDWYRVCMEVFRQRDRTEYSWYPQEPPTEPDVEEPEKPDPLPDWAEKEYKRELSRYNGRMNRYEREKHQWDLLERAREGDLHAANELIELRKDGEYEGYEVEEFSDVNESVPYWAHSEQEQLDRCEKALDRIIRTEGDTEALENAREAVSSCAEQSDSPSTGESRRFHYRSARKLARYNLRRVLGEFDRGDDEEALAVAERVRNRLEGWKESR